MNLRYDPLSRLKEVETLDASAVPGFGFGYAFDQLTEATKFLYDGWNLIWLFRTISG